MTPLPTIEHVILLMFENRSFDNMLGAFYPGTQDGGGVPSGWSNPWPGNPDVLAWQAQTGGPALDMPYPDPNELYANMSVQINGNGYGAMKGFVIDYATVANSSPPDIMQYYTGENVPVTSALAMAYAASDRYFASGPVQTWPNRLFSLCGTPGYDPRTRLAYLNNTEYPEYPFIDGQFNWPTIFEQLDNAGASWKVYFEDEVPICAILNYVWENWDWLECGGNVFPFENDPLDCGRTFFDDVMNDTLPAFSLIEPRYQMYSFEGDVAPTSNHPGSSSPIDNSGVPINISCGEQMLAKVFQALAANSALFEKTLLIVTYDEHGGLFDHVLPPAAVSPFQPGSVTNFNYDVYGVRVPALFINPYVQPGLFPPPPDMAFDHTSILATLRDQFGLSGSLSPRVDQAPTFTGLVDNSLQPIIAPSIPLPQCVWSPPSLEGAHAEPILRSALSRARLGRRHRPR
jgi:phospholipase C